MLMLKIIVEDRNRLELETPMLATGVFEGEEPDGAVRRIDEALGGALCLEDARGGERND